MIPRSKTNRAEALSIVNDEREPESEIRFRLGDADVQLLGNDYENNFFTTPHKERFQC